VLSINNTALSSLISFKKKKKKKGIITKTIVLIMTTLIGGILLGVCLPTEFQKSYAILKKIYSISENQKMS
jgi:hypothetical protein